MGSQRNAKMSLTSLGSNSRRSSRAVFKVGKDPKENVAMVSAPLKVETQRRGEAPCVGTGGWALRSYCKGTCPKRVMTALHMTADQVNEWRWEQVMMC